MSGFQDFYSTFFRYKQLTRLDIITRNCYHKSFPCIFIVYSNCGSFLPQKYTVVTMPTCHIGKSLTGHQQTHTPSQPLVGPHSYKKQPEQNIITTSTADKPIIGCPPTHLKVKCKIRLLWSLFLSTYTTSIYTGVLRRLMC